MLPDGLYDNRATYRRELYKDGEMVVFASTDLIYCYGDIFHPPWDKDWGTYPDVPERKS